MASLNADHLYLTSTLTLTFLSSQGWLLHTGLSVPFLGPILEACLSQFVQVTVKAVQCNR
jgi:hypothetical protein